MDKNQDTSEEVEIKVPCEIYSRIVGYLTPVQNWNDGKRQEFADRLTFDRMVNDERTTQQEL